MKNNVNTKQVYIYENLPSGGAKNIYKSNIEYLKSVKALNLTIASKENVKFKNLIEYIVYVFNKWFEQDINKINKLNTYDVIICYQDWITKSPYFIRNISKPIIYICHEVPREFYDKDYRKLFDFKDYVVNSILIFVKLFDRINILSGKNLHIVSNSQLSKRNIYRAYGINSQIIYPAISNKIVNNVSYEDREYQILCVGSINKLKNQLFVLQVVSKIELKYRPKVLFIGNGMDHRYVDKLKIFAKDNNIDMIIKLNVTNQVLQKSYAQSRVYIYNPIAEPFGLTVLEAMSSGLPILAGDSGGYSEILSNHNGKILRTKNLKIWSDNLLELLINKNLWKNISKFNHNMSNNYDSHDMNSQLYEIIQKVGRIS